MTKRKRKPEKAPAKPTTDPIATLSKRAKLVEDVRIECKAQLKLIIDGRKTLPPGQFDAKLTAAVNTLSKSIAILSAEGRQLDKHRDQIVIDLEPDAEDAIVRDFLSDISPARRAAFREYLSDEDDSDALLGH